MKISEKLNVSRDLFIAENKNEKKNGGKKVFKLSLTAGDFETKFIIQGFQYQKSKILLRLTPFHSMAIDSFQYLTFGYFCFRSFAHEAFAHLAFRP